MNVFMLIAGLFLIIFPIFKVLRERSVIKNGIKATARIVEIKERRWRYGITYDVMVIFNADGEDYVVKNPAGAKIDLGWKAGDTIEILYHKNNPKRAVTTEGYRLTDYFAFVVMLLVGTIIAIYYLVMF